MSLARYLIGDVFDVMAKLPDNSVDLVLTSPPFLALRSYLPVDHPDKDKEIGSEPTPAEFIDTLLALTAEWERLLAPHGSIAVELGDTYSGSGGRGESSVAGWTESRQYQGMSNAKDGTTSRAQSGPGWPLDKSLCIIPELYAASLAYGRNILTGEPSPAGQWRVRNLVRWVRPNPPVGALGDKYRPATSTMVITCKARDRWFDLDAVRTERPDLTPTAGGNMDPRNQRDDDWRRGKKPESGGVVNPAGAPPLDWWQIPTEAYAGSHYATWPRRLCTIPIDSMCPRHVCTTCGQPRRRIVETRRVDANGETVTGNWNADNYESGAGYTGSQGAHTRRSGTGVGTNRTDLGWSDCGHDTNWMRWRPGIVLDPFAGSGTTLAVATGMGRDAIGIDIDHRNADLAAQRVGMFLTVEADA